VLEIADETDTPGLADHSNTSAILLRACVANCRRRIARSSTSLLR
jgi:hypothetical protein